MIPRHFFIVVAFAISLQGCFFKKDENSFSGTLVATETAQLIFIVPEPSISLLGQSTVLDIEYNQASANTNSVGFTIKGLSAGSYTFDIAQAGQLDAAISFPITLSSNIPFTLPALGLGQTASLTQAAVTAGLITSQLPTAGIILGKVNSLGSGCLPNSSVVLSSASGLTGSTVAGPFYFDSFGQIQPGTSFLDNQCRYAFFNVPEGNHVLSFIGNSGQTLQQTQLIVLQGRVSYGLNIP